MPKYLESDHYDEVSTFLSRKIVEFNQKHWGDVKKEPLAVTFRDGDDQIVAGASGVAFGQWLMIERLWVDEVCRGQGIGQVLLNELEAQAKTRKCIYAFVDTLEFQAKPFYEKLGYKLVFKQSHYPVDGARFYLTKRL
jgi:GNAT superfamily N-acetyltransferase